MPVPSTRNCTKDEREAPTRPDGSRRLLLVCYHFGRHRHTGGFRWRAMARHLQQEGWHLDVICKDPTETSERFASPPPSLGPGVAVHTVPQHWWGQQLRQKALALLSQVQSFLPAPDDRAHDERPLDPEAMVVWSPEHRTPVLKRFKEDVVGTTALMRDAVWTHRAWKSARALARHNQYHAVIVSSPRHLNHLVGAMIARHFDVPYVADYRDPWYFGRRADRALLDDAKRLAGRRCEAWTLHHACVAVDIAEKAQREVQDELEERELEDRPPRRFIPNGYTPSASAPPPPDSECFRVVYTGWLWPFVDVRPVLRACKRLQQKHALAPHSFNVAFVGSQTHLGGVSFEKLARALGLSNYFERLPRISPEEADAVQQRAAVMIAFDSVCSRGLCIPSKLYHYSQTRGAILPIGRLDGAMAEEAAKIGVNTYAPSDEDGIYHMLDAAYRRWKEDDFEAPIDAEGVFDMRRSSNKMHALLAELPHQKEA